MSTAHDHAPARFDRAFAIGIGLNTAFVAIEAYYGWRIDSLALLADAGHNLSDVAGLVLAWGGALAGQLRPDHRHTYGWKRASILAAFINALLLLVAMGSLVWEAVHRLQSPQPIEGVTIMLVAAVGIVVNTSTALLFMRGREERPQHPGRLPAHGGRRAGVGGRGGGRRARAGFRLGLDRPRSQSADRDRHRGRFGKPFEAVRASVVRRRARQRRSAQVQALLESLPGVARVHDLHVWAMGTSQVALTAHLVMPQGEADDGFLESATSQLHDRFEIEHVTLQVVRVPFARPCATPAPPAAGLAAGEMPDAHGQTRPLASARPRPPSRRQHRLTVVQRAAGDLDDKVLAPTSNLARAPACRVTPGTR